jgi:hypothetical protein
MKYAAHSFGCNRSGFGQSRYSSQSLKTRPAPRGARRVEATKESFMRMLGLLRNQVANGVPQRCADQNECGA